MKFQKIVISVFLLIIVLALFSWKNIQPPKNFPVPYSFLIQNGQTLFSISEDLHKNNIIQSKQFFQIAMLLFGSDTKISVGEYYFEKPLSVFEVALRISGKQFGVEKIKVTFPEGFTTKDMEKRLSEKFINFDSELFLSLSEKHEGYLFPDTYYFFPSTSIDVIVNAMRKNFDKKIQSLEKDITNSGRTREQIIIMASLIEKEARGENDRHIISGILWTRFDKGMLLQVDAPFLYLLGKESRELTRADLAINSPFNTYRYKGLPPSPINNPGIASIEAALYPEKSPYLFYLHDESGAIYYGKTYTEHLQNIKKYLR